MTRSLTLVGLHGLGGDRGQPLSLLDEVVRSTCMVFAPDLRAHGACDLDASRPILTFERLALDVAGWLAHLRRPTLLMGVSMGAGVALELLARRLPGVVGLVLVRPAWLWEASPANLAPFPEIAGLLRAHGAREGRERFVRGETFARIAAVSSGAAAALAAQFDAPRAVERAARLEAFPASAPRRPSSVRVPVVVLAGDRDPVHPVRLADELATDLRAEMRLVPPRYDRPEEHARVVAREIRRVVEEA